jgi:hypothetical protein
MLKPSDITLLGFLLTILAGGLGVFVASFVKDIFDKKSRNFQLTEKIRDEDSQRVIETINSLNLICVEYWQNDAKTLANKEPTSQAKINALQHYINEQVSLLFEGHIALLREVQVASVDFIDAVSGGDFGSSNRKKNYERIQSIELESYRLVHIVRKCRRLLPKSRL